MARYPGHDLGLARGCLRYLLTPESKLGAVFDETYWAFKENRREEYLPPWNFFWRLNGGSNADPTFNYRGTVENVVYCCQELTDQGNGIVGGSHCRPMEPWERSSRFQGYSLSCTGGWFLQPGGRMQSRSLIRNPSELSGLAQGCRPTFSLSIFAFEFRFEK